MKCSLPAHRAGSAENFVVFPQVLLAAASTLSVSLTSGLQKHKRENHHVQNFRLQLVALFYPVFMFPHHSPPFAPLPNCLQTVNLVLGAKLIQ